jgi:excisionase family DNA binding protein
MASNDSCSNSQGCPASDVHDARSSRVTARAFPIAEFCRAYGIGRTTAYQEIAAGRLRAVKVGQRTLIASDAAEAWLAALPEIKQSNRSLAERRGNNS